MSDGLFREGGPHRIRRTGDHLYELAIKLPKDNDGLVGRRCPVEDCSPGYFKIAADVEGAFCPYCATRGSSKDFHTEAQVRYAKDVLLQEAKASVSRALARGFGFSEHGGRRTLGGGGLFSVELSFKPGRTNPARRPFEEALRRDLTCASCSARHAVFGLATHCPACGLDIFLQHVGAEAEVLRKVLGDVQDRRTKFGARVAARDVENVLEDVVSIFEAVLKAIVRRALVSKGGTESEIESIFKKQVRNTFQSVSRGRDLARALLGVDPFSETPEADVERLRVIFEKRHPITHNLGVVDRKYLEQVQHGEREGREVRVDESEILWALERVESVLAEVYRRAVGTASNHQQESEA